MIEALSASSWRAGGAASRLTPPTIRAWDCFGARAKPPPRSPWRARGSPKRPPKTSPKGANNDRSGAGADQVGDQLQDHQGFGLVLPEKLLARADEVIE